MAGEISLEPPPPYHSFSSHAPPSTWESPHTRLIDDRWYDLIISKLKDLAEFQEKKAKINAMGRTRLVDDGSAALVDPKGKAKAKAGEKEKERRFRKRSLPVNDA